MGEPQDIVGYYPGDKVRVRVNPHRGLRGVIDAVQDGLLRIRLTTNDVVDLQPEDITNYSLAARRAWESMPKRAGRPPGAGPRKKMVSLRLDAEVWGRLGQAVERGLITSREQAVNIWVRERLDELCGEAAIQCSKSASSDEAEQSMT